VIKKEYKYKILSSLFYLVLLIIVITWAFPIIWVALDSLKPDRLITSSKIIWRFKPTFKHYQLIFSTHNFARYFFNSTVVSTISTIISVIFGFLAGYSITRFKTGGTALTIWILITRVAPPAAVLLPLFLIFRILGLIDTLYALIIVDVSLNLSFVIWLMRTFFEEIPPELEEAAMIDGANYISTLWLIVFPLVRPGLVAATTFSFVFAWNEYLFALVLTVSQNAKTLPVAAGDFVTAYGIEWGPIFASGTLILIPIMIFSLFLQRYLVRGLTFGAIK